MKPKPDLFERMLTEAQGAFSLAAAAEGIDVAEGRETELVNMAMQAGVVGALGVEREDVPVADLAKVESMLTEVLGILRDR